MDCADTNCWIAYLSGANGADVDRMDEALAGHFLRMAPVVLAELLSDPNLPKETADFLQQIPLLSVSEDCWVRAGKLRARMFSLGYKPKLADTLVAQSCLDHDALLLSRDRDFRGFVAHCQLRVFP